ncbi:MAG: ABC transporter permease [Bacteroidetes bacterium]|nr:ABC transporter permease [Bacteroidota bacterium]
MFKNYFKTAWRNIIRSKGYSFLNISGLAIGMAVALLIGLWAHYQYSYDKFLPNYQQAYRVQRNFNSNGDTLTFPTTSLKLADALKREIPEIEYVAESDWTAMHGLVVGDKKFYMRGAITGTDFLRIFQFPLAAGSVNTVFKDAYSIVLTKATAKTLFGSDDPVGKMVRFDNKNDLKVTGVLENIPNNSSFQFDYLVPFSYAEQTNEYIKANRNGSYGNNGYQLFVKLKPGVSYSQIASKIRNIEHTETDNVNAMFSYVILQPMKNWHMFGNYVNGKELDGFIVYVRMFSMIGALVLMIACINFINLTTARSEKRAKEVGVRKAIGSQRKDLIVQFLAESFLLTLIAFLFSILLVQLALPAFNNLTKDKISIPFSNIFFWIIMFVSLVITALLAGSRPAFYLSSFNPVKVLKGTMKVGKIATWPRKILVVIQFACSVALIISTIIIYQQIQHAKNRPAGFDLNRVMTTNMNEDLSRNYIAIKNELIQSGITENVTTSSSPATDVYWHTDIDKWPGKNAGETVEMGAMYVTADYFKTLGIKMQEGRPFEGLSDTLSVIFNETAIKRLRIKQPLNQTITTYNQQHLKIVGIAKDALMVSPFSPADPTMFFLTQYPQDIMMYKLSPRISTQDAINKLTKIFNKYNPAYPYNYQFADANYAAKFNFEVLVGKLAGIFASLAIFISCLGLFGLSAYIAEQKTKEIGIRKVLGASVSQVWLLLSKDFILLVIISCVIASPVALYFLQQWLMKYDYRISIGPAVFIIAALMALVITLVTISFQAIKAALSNPVKSLRSE